MVTKKVGFFTVPISSRNQKIDQKGYLYIVRIKETNDYKIGTTKNLPNRISSLSGFKPYDIELVFSSDRPVTENRKKEKMILDKYSYLKTKGEWICATQSQILEIVNDILKIQTNQEI